MKYPGLNFTPPEGAIDPEATEGEALVTWKKVGDKFTITEFEGQSLGGGRETMMEEEMVDDGYVSPEEDMRTSGL